MTGQENKEEQALGLARCWSRYLNLLFHLHQNQAYVTFFSGVLKRSTRAIGISHSFHYVEIVTPGFW